MIPRDNTYCWTVHCHTKVANVDCCWGCLSVDRVNNHMKLPHECGSQMKKSVTDLPVITWRCQINGLWNVIGRFILMKCEIFTRRYQLMDCGMCHDDVDYWNVNTHMMLSADGLWNVPWRCRLLKCKYSHDVIS